MSHVASLELCKALYEVSGWGDTYLRYWVNSQSGATIDHSPAIFGFGKTENTNIEAYPAYDLGYLMRKLGGWDVKLFYSNQWRRWNCFVDETGESADTPEDATVKLCLALFEYHILTKEKENRE